ncbi:MAG TPA: hypothetical protein VM370_04010 [Candidatus Thermoplasmatota archaeon]|nr:hypothetical protein [Candidatus Thermoplasmatota archaeon]
MRVQVRETGSILVSARKDEVLSVLQRVVREGAWTAPDRLEGAGFAYILRDAPAGTTVIHARAGSAAVPRATREREELRREVESDLFRLRSLFEVRSSDKRDAEPFS